MVFQPSVVVVISCAFQSKILREHVRYYCTLVKASIRKTNIVKIMLKNYNKCCTLAGLSESSADLEFNLADD